VFPISRSYDQRSYEDIGVITLTNSLETKTRSPVNTGKVLVECKGLKKEFHIPGAEPNKVLRGIDLTLKEGEFVTLMGPSGCGKSTLLNIIGGLIPGSGGEVKVSGRSLMKMGHRELADVRRNDVGWIFQDFNLIVNLTALENVMVPMYLSGKSGPDIEKKAIEILSRVGLLKRMDHFPDTLSGGQQQRVAIARAIVNEPKIIVADEPTGNLDSNTGREIIELFKDLASGGTGVLMVTHDVILANSSQKTYVLRNGVLHSSLDKEVVI
jgi:putative ABC transport system ATP-binding protein